MKKCNRYLLQIQDPSGETREVRLDFSNLEKEIWIGRHEDVAVRLRDPTVAPKLGKLIQINDQIWFEGSDPSHPARLGDLNVLKTQWPTDMSIHFGETVVRLLQDQGQQWSLPVSPSGVKAWQTFSESGKDLLWMVKKSAATPLSIYLGGETGVGKEVLAHLIHAWSERSSGTFVPLNCAALPLSLAESELFGHVKGAFTGASNHRSGALMQAHNGTLFLDEIGDLPSELQVKLLRFLENGEIRAVGSDRSTRADVRIVCATHKPLEQLVEEGKFRRDLYFRLASISISIPALRNRPEDIENLAKQFAKDLNRSLTPQAILRLKAHSWPGNVRELRHAIERACGFSGAFQETLPESAFEFLVPSGKEILNGQRNPELDGVLTLAEMERVLILKTLKLTSGNRAAAAKTLGVARSTLFEMIKRHRICGPKRSAYWLEEIAQRQA